MSERAPTHDGERAVSIASPDDAAGDGRRTTSHDALLNVRTADIEPFTGLRYLSKLFRVIALLLVLMLVAEVVTGFARQGVDAIPTLVAEASRLIVLAGLLWGIGDLAILLIDVGHDVRAARILLARLVATVAHPTQRPVLAAAGPVAARSDLGGQGEPPRGETGLEQRPG